MRKIVKFIKMKIVRISRHRKTHVKQKLIFECLSFNESIKQVKILNSGLNEYSKFIYVITTENFELNNHNKQNNV